MFDTKYFEEIAKKLYSTLPTNLRELENDFQKKFKEILLIAFSKIDLVTREEFDVQVKVLERTREKLEQLQLTVQNLQNKNSITSTCPEPKE